MLILTLRHGFLLALAALLIGCSNNPPNYYLLNILSDPDPQASLVAPSEIIGLERIELPGYLDQSRLMRRTGNNTLSVHQNDQWSEPLDEGVQRVLAANLARLLPNTRVRQAPWPRGVVPERRLALQIERFDAGGDGSVLFTGSWTITNRSDSGARQERRFHFHFRLPSQGESHEDVAALMSQALVELCKKIVRDLDLD